MKRFKDHEVLRADDLNELVSAIERATAHADATQAQVAPPGVLASLAGIFGAAAKRNPAVSRRRLFWPFRWRATGGAA
jgi:hypothetical protein